MTTTVQHESERFDELVDRLRAEGAANYTVDATRIEGEVTGPREEARVGAAR